MSNAVTPAEVQRAQELYEPLTQTLRRLLDVTIRSEADEDDVRRAHALLEEAAGLLGSRCGPEPFGVRTSTDGRPLAWGNIAYGLRNAIAPPLVVVRDEAGGAAADLDLGAPYEGPPGHVHGGMSALILDHVLSATAHRPGQPAFTGTLTVRYLRPTRLGRLHVAAWLEREEGSKTFAAGHITDAEGVVTVQAEGVFIRPKEKS